MISVIVPYWNSGKWLDRCCQSLHKQKGDFEFILVDDHSEDNGVDIVEKYVEMDSRFVSLINEHRKGVSGARNTGINWASGEWVTFLDADDELTDKAGRLFFKEINKTQAQMIEFNHKRFYRLKNKYLVKFANAGGDYKLPNLPDAWWGVWNKLFRTELIKNIRFDESLSYGEDGMFVLECLAVDDTIHHADIDALTVIHNFDNPESLSKIKNIDDIRKYIRAYEEFAFDGTQSKAMQKVVCRELQKLWLRIEDLL